MGQRRRTVLFLFATGLVLAVAGCAAGESPSAGSPSPSLSPSASPGGSPSPGTPSTSPAPSESSDPAPPLPPPPGDGTTRVVVERAGGFAGGMERLLVQPNGAWLYTGARGGKGGGKPQSGQLTAEQMNRLQTLVSSPQFRQEAALKRGPAECNDGFQYSVSTGEVTVAWQTCSPADAPPTAAEVISLLGAATPL